MIVGMKLYVVSQPTNHRPTNLGYKYIGINQLMSLLIDCSILSSFPFDGEVGGGETGWQV